MKHFRRYLYLFFIPISLACAVLSGQRNLLPTSTESANNNSTNNDYLLTNLVSRDPSLWFPSQTTLDTDEYIPYKGEYSNSNSDIADGDQDYLSTLNNYGRIVSFGHEWEIPLGNDRLAPKYYYKSSNAILVKSADSAKELFEYYKQFDVEDKGLFSIKDITIGDGGYLFIAEHKDRYSEYLNHTLVNVLFYRNNVISDTRIETFVWPKNLSKVNVENLAIQLAKQIDKAILVESSQHSGTQAELDALNDSYFSTTTTPVDLGNPNDYLTETLYCSVNGRDFVISGKATNNGQYPMILTVTTVGETMVGGASGGGSGQIGLAAGTSKEISSSFGYDPEGKSTSCSADVSVEWAP